MKFNPNFRLFNLDKKAYLDRLDGYLMQKLRGGGRKWLDATVRTRTHIPTWSGASRGTFIKLAREFGTSVPIGPIRARRNMVQDGINHAARSGLRVNPSKGEWAFEYIHTLPGLIWNETNLSVPGPWPQPWSPNVRYLPYRIQDKGAAAWMEYAAKVKLPSITRYITTRKL